MPGSFLCATGEHDWDKWEWYTLETYNPRYRRGCMRSCGIFQEKSLHSMYKEFKPGDIEDFDKGHDPYKVLFSSKSEDL